MTKYVLKAIDDNDDAMASTVTYEFQVELLDDMTYHLAQFLRSAGFTYVDEVKIIKENDEEVIGEIEE